MLPLRDGIAWTYAVRRGMVIALLMLATGCGSTGPVSPTETAQPAALPPQTPPPRSFPPLSGLSRTFLFRGELSYRVHDTTKQSRFVLYDNGAFVLVPKPWRGRVSRKVHIEANGVISFEWEGWSTAGPWGAIGTLKGDSMTVQCNLIMQMTDFEDAEYALMR